MAQEDKKPKLKSMKLTPERTMEVADSLEKVGYRKKGFGNTQKSMAEGAIKSGKPEQTTYDQPSRIQRLEIGNKALKDASKDLSNAKRYKLLALKAMNKNK